MEFGLKIRKVKEKNFNIGWMRWEEVLPFVDQLSELEYRLMVDYHYPDWTVPGDYSYRKVRELERHMVSGNTYFWGIIDGEILAGYYWAYISDFLDWKRWNLRSLFIREEYRGLGFGKEAVETGLLLAEALGCSDAATEYAIWNGQAADIYRKAGYMPTRVEVVKTIRGGRTDISGLSG